MASAKGTIQKELTEYVYVKWTSLLRKLAFSIPVSASCNHFFFSSKFLKKIQSKYSGHILLFPPILYCKYYTQSLIVSLWKKYTIWVLLADVKKTFFKFTTEIGKKGNTFKHSSEEKMEVQKFILASWQSNMP